MLDEDLAELVLAVALLPVHRLAAAARGDPAASQQNVAEPVAPVDDRRVDDLALVEVDRAEVVPVGERQAAGPPPQGEQLDHVGEARLLEASLDRHQRQSSIRRSPRSGHSHTIFSRLRAPPTRGRDDRRSSAGRTRRACAAAGASAGGPATRRRATSRASATDGGTLRRLRRVEHALQLRDEHARIESAGRFARYSTSSESARASLAASSRATTPLADLAVGRAEARPRARPRAGCGAAAPGPASSASGTADVKIICRPDSSSMLKSRNSSSCVRSLSAMRCTSSRRKAATRR